MAKCLKCDDIFSREKKTLKIDQYLMKYCVVVKYARHLTMKFQEINKLY